MSKNAYQARRNIIAHILNKAIVLIANDVTRHFTSLSPMSNPILKCWFNLKEKLIKMMRVFRVDFTHIARRAIAPCMFHFKGVALFNLGNGNACTLSNPLPVKAASTTNISYY